MEISHAGHKMYLLGRAGDFSRRAERRRL